MDYAIRQDLPEDMEDESYIPHTDKLLRKVSRFKECGGVTTHTSDQKVKTIYKCCICRIVLILG